MKLQIMEDLLKFMNYQQISWQYFFPLLIVVAYLLYLRKFRFFRIDEKYDSQLVRHKIPRGKCPPSYPFGWYRLKRSGEMKPGYSNNNNNDDSQVFEIKLCGRHIVYYRGLDQQLYCVSAYCTHMGSNLGGGKIKNMNCIECPFHGWLFDGKTGQCVNSELKDAKLVKYHQYEDIKFQTSAKIVECGEGETSLDTYIIKEVKGIVYIWLHHKSMQIPLFEIPSIDMQHLQLRGESVNYVNCHIQEIPENGADVKHFDLIHDNAIDLFYPFMKAKWTMKSKEATDKDFNELMVHDLPRIRVWQDGLFKQMLKDIDRKFVNVLSLDGYIIIFDRWKFHTLNATGFQLGSATVALFIKGYFFEALFQQSIQPIEKFSLRVYHTCWTNGYLPYWLSAFILSSEVRQVLFDVKIWNKKRFSDQVKYNLKNQNDQILLKWRRWYNQFYEGCQEFENTLESLEW